MIPRRRRQPSGKGKRGWAVFCFRLASHYNCFLVARHSQSSRRGLAPFKNKLYVNEHPPKTNLALAQARPASYHCPKKQAVSLPCAAKCSDGVLTWARSKYSRRIAFVLSQSWNEEWSRSRGDYSVLFFFGSPLIGAVKLLPSRACVCLFFLRANMFRRWAKSVDWQCATIFSWVIFLITDNK